MSVSARDATDADRATIDRLRAAAFDEMRPLRGGRLYVDRDAPAFDGDGLWVGELAGEVVGYLAASVDGRIGRVDGVYVDPACRSVGVGEAMITAALDWFRARGCSGVDAVALPGARATKNFFEETGFSARLLVMHREL